MNDAAFQPDDDRSIATAAGAILDAIGGADSDLAARLADELRDLRKLLHEVEAFEELLLAEHTDAARRKELIESLFKARADRATSPSARMPVLLGVASELDKALQARQGKVEVLLTTAVPLDDARKASAAATLEDALQSKVVLTARVEPGLLGGARVQVGDSVFDASLSARLRHVRDRLSSAAAAADILEETPR